MREERLSSDYGSFWLRLVGWVIDVIVFAVVTGIVSILGGNVVGSFLGLAIGIGYYVGLNAHGGTLGKRAVGLRLESAATGADIGYGAALVRYVVAFASMAVLLLGYLWVFWDDRNQTWHDKAAGSVVVTHRTRQVDVEKPSGLHDLDIRRRMQEMTDKGDSDV